MHCRTLFAWVVLPNHYHVLCEVIDLNAMFQALGKSHGRISFQWNGEDNSRGRQTWYKAAVTAMKSEGHFYASRNYIFNNPLLHGYCAQWSAWPFSNATGYPESVGRQEAVRYLRFFPLYDYGKDRDSKRMWGRAGVPNSAARS